MAISRETEWRPAPPVTLRSMREADLEEVMRIERRSFTTPWTERTFRGLMRRPNAALLVAEVEERVAGYLALWFAAAEAELGDLAVLPELRGRGVGAALVAGAVREAAQRGASSVFLEVRVSNAAARRLYERAGFEVVGVRRRYYTAPSEDALVMRCRLKTPLR
ncbi:MAG: ribosomal protein S18-alanine N-acetyltransferase [Gemmatimonadota bacterium]